MRRTLGPAREAAYARTVSASVEVHLFAAAKAAVGLPTVTAEPGPLAVVLDGLSTQYPAFAQVRPRCSFLVDGLTAGPATAVPPGGRVDVLPPFAGG